MMLYMLEIISVSVENVPGIREAVRVVMKKITAMMIAAARANFSGFSFAVFIFCCLVFFQRLRGRLGFRLLR